MGTITVSCRKFDKQAFAVQKYSNDEGWNVEGGHAPNGVGASRYLRRTTPNTKQLSPLASWLVENLPRCVAGRMGGINDSKVRVYSGRTYADMAGLPGWHNLGTLKTSNTVDDPVRIDDWLFSVIDPKQTDVEYWNHEARKMVAAGGVRVEITASGHIEATLEQKTLRTFAVQPQEACHG